MKNEEWWMCVCSRADGGYHNRWSPEAFSNTHTHIHTHTHEEWREWRMKNEEWWMCVCSRADGGYHNRWSPEAFSNTQTHTHTHEEWRMKNEEYRLRWSPEAPWILFKMITWCTRNIIGEYRLMHSRIRSKARNLFSLRSAVEVVPLLSYFHSRDTSTAPATAVLLPLPSNFHCRATFTSYFHCRSTSSADLLPLRSYFHVDLLPLRSYFHCRATSTAELLPLSSLTRTGFRLPQKLKTWIITYNQREVKM